MVPLSLGREKIDRILDAACERLHGEWLLVGGAAAAVWFSPDRVTEDVDLFAFQSSNAEQLAVMQLATEHGLPVEAINLAASFFVSRIEGWRDEIEVLRAGAHATVYRPTATLFLLLKVGRLGEQDLDDCLTLLAFARENNLPVKQPRVLAALRALPTTNDQALTERRQKLSDALEDD